MPDAGTDGRQKQEVRAEAKRTSSGAGAGHGCCEGSVSSYPRGATLPRQAGGRDTWPCFPLCRRGN